MNEYILIKDISWQSTKTGKWRKHTKGVKSTLI